MPSAESLIVKAAFKLISEDARVLSTYKPARLLELGTDPVNPGPKDLFVSWRPVKPEWKPTSSENVYVEIEISPVFSKDATTRDSGLGMLDEYNEFRKLLAANCPLLNPDNSGIAVSDANVTFDFRDASRGDRQIRIPRFIALYSEKIDPTTGAHAA